jgi:hypothetical protein
MVYLVPRSAEGKRLAAVWISWHDLAGGGFLAVDGALIFVLMTLGEASIEQQLVFVFLIRVARFFRLATYWAKVSSFHYLRAMAFKSQIVPEVVEGDDEEGLISPGHMKTSSFVSGAGNAAHRAFLHIPGLGGHRAMPSTGGESVGSSVAGGGQSTRRSVRMSTRQNLTQIWQRQPGYVPSANPWADFRRSQTGGGEDNNNNAGDSMPDLDFDEI